MILDGYGMRDTCEHNAVCEAKTPIMDQLMSQCPFVRGNASGLAVGLPDGQMGNSEVGHLNMGAGRIVYQELTRITKSIEDGDFFENPEFLAAADTCKKNDSALHLFGLVSDGGVHSHLTHLFGLLEFAKRQGLKKVYVHCFLDGRDTPPTSGKEFVAELEKKMQQLGIGEVASVMGRYYAMDRDKNWDRVQKAYDVLTKAEGEKAESACAGIQASYDKEVNDEFVVPFYVEKDGKPVATIQDGDSVIFFNHIESKDNVIRCYVFTIGPFDTLTNFYCPLGKIIIGLRHAISNLAPLFTICGIHFPQMSTHQLMNTESHLGTCHVAIKLTRYICWGLTLNDQCLGTRSSYFCSNTFRCCCSACIC